MAIIIPNAAEQLWLKHVLNQTAPEDQTLKLFTNNVTPDDTFTESSFTEASGGGYANKPLVGTSWSIATNANDEAEATYVAQTYTFTGALTGGATIYGWYLTETTSGLLLACERNASSITPVNNGDNIIINPRLQLFSEN